MRMHVILPYSINICIITIITCVTIIINVEGLGIWPYKYLNNIIIIRLSIGHEKVRDIVRSYLAL